MLHGDEHDITLYFGPSSHHASKCSIPNDFFYDSLCDLIFDILMAFIKDPSSFIPYLDYKL